MTDEAWSGPRRIGFRFGILAALLLFGDSIAVLVPGGELACFRAWHWVVVRFGALLGLDVPPLVFTGSGDTLFHYLQLLLIVILAAVGTAVWTALDRRRAYPRLAAAATVALRYYLAVVLIGYGMAKVLPLQFPPLWVGRYDQSIGDMSPMGLLWSFMGHSQPYTFIAGAAEVLGAFLLLWRRTYVIGAALIAIVMANVVALNFSYDVPVKLFSSELLLVALVLLVPHLRRIIRALLGRATPEVPPRVRGSLRYERARLVLKAVMIAMMALRVVGLVDFVQRAPEVTELQGVWRADRVVIDGVERPPLLTDSTRWRKLIFFDHRLAVRYTTDRREYFHMDLDPATRTIAILDGVQRTLWHYDRPDREHLVIDSPNTHAELSLEPAPLLQTRGFHWIQEAPFNR